MTTEETIVLFNGQSQYDVLRHFVKDLAHAFRTLGYDAEIIDLLDPSWTSQLETLVREKSISFFLSINGVGIELKVGQNSLYDQLNIPFFAFLVDHPMYHLQRLIAGVNQLIVSCVDETHVSFLQNYMKGQYTKVFIPHGAAAYDNGNIPMPMQKRKTDILFAGSYADPEQERSKWTAFGPFVANLFDNILEAGLYESEISLADTAEKVVLECGVDPDYMQQARFWQLMIHVDQYIRRYRRRKIVSAITRLPLKVEIYGNGWSELGIEATPSLSFHPPLDFKHMVQKMGQSKIVPTVLPNFPQGGHERIFTAMLHGAACLSDSNKYLKNHFDHGSDFISYSVQDDNLDHILKHIEDLDRLQELAIRGRNKALDFHTWIHRATRIIETVSYHKFFIT